MDFKEVIPTLIQKFDKQGINYGLIGGFAMGLWGMGRTTVDIDFLVSRDDMIKVDSIMRDMGYECRYQSEDVSQYVSPLKVFGEIDFIHAFRKYAIAMLERAHIKTIFDKIKIRVLRPEDLIGLKLQAIKNAPDRKGVEMQDISFLIKNYKSQMDWEIIKEYATVLDMEEIYQKLKKV